MAAALGLALVQDEIHGIGSALAKEASANLRAVADERTRLELAIAEQQRRRDAALQFLERLDSGFQSIFSTIRSP